MTILLPVMASSTICLADMTVPGEEDAIVEKKDPTVRLYIPWNIAPGEKA